MKIELKKLTIDDGADVYDMLQTMPEENGFMNPAHGISFDRYKKWLVDNDNASKGIGLADWMVPQDIYWLYADGVPVGMGKLRHHLTDALRVDGGHCGYGIAPAHRGKGHGKTMLGLLLQKARELGIDNMLVTIDNHNTPSIKVALANGGVVDKTTEMRHYIWLSCH